MSRCGAALRLGRATALGIALTAAVQISPALAVDNVAPTHTLVAEQYQLMRMLVANLTSGLASMDTLIERVKHECSTVASEAPPSASSQAQKLVQEMGGTLLITLLHNDRRAIRRYVRAIVPLQWSASKITSIVKSETTKLEKLSDIAIPDLCLNVREWAERNFAVLPRLTVQFDRQLTASEGGLQPTDIKIIKSYEDASTKVLVRHVAVLRRRFKLRERRPALRGLFALVQTIFGEKCTP